MMSTAIKISVLRKKLECARSILGKPLPEPLIDRLVNDYEDLEIGTASTLERDMHFFRTFKDDLILIDQYGHNFKFSESARQVKYQEVFVGIKKLRDGRFRLYAHFRF